MEWKDWEIYRRPHRTISKRVIAPSVHFWVEGTFLNRVAVELVGEDKRAVVLSYNPIGEQVGFWFWKDKQTLKEHHEEYTRDAYKVTHYPSFKTARISCKSFIEDYKILQKVAGKKSFLLRLQKDPQPNASTGQDFYVVDLKG